MEKILIEATRKVLDELLEVDKGELLKELRKHRQGDIATFFVEMGVFRYNTYPPRGLYTSENFKHKLSLSFEGGAMEHGRRDDKGNPMCKNCTVTLEFIREANDLNDMPMIVSYWKCPYCGGIIFD